MEENKKNNKEKEHEHKPKHKPKPDNDKCTIHNSGNPIINVKVNCCCDHNKNKKDDHKKHDDCCCGHKEVERQVNNPTNDVANFPRITQSETSLAHFNDFILYGFNDSNDDIGERGMRVFQDFLFLII